MKTIKVLFVMVAVSFFSPSFATEGNFFGQVGEFLENLDVEFTITAPVVQHQTHQQPIYQPPVHQQPVHQQPQQPCNNRNRRGNRINCTRPNNPRTVVQQPVYVPVPQPVQVPVYVPVYTPVQSTPVQTHTSATTNGYQGYASYQDYLDAYYAADSSASSHTSYEVPKTSYSSSSSSSTGYQGYASYEAYLDAYYADSSSSSHTSYDVPKTSYTSSHTTTYTPTVHTDKSDGYMGYASYQDYLDHYHAASASSSSSSHGSGGSGSSNSSSYSKSSSTASSGTSYVASAQVSTTPIHVPQQTTYTASTSISYSHLPSGYFNLGYDQGYIIDNNIRMNLVDIEPAHSGNNGNVLVLRVVQNNQPRQVRVNLNKGKQTILQVGGKRLQVVGLERVNNRNVVRCYLLN